MLAARAAAPVLEVVEREEIAARLPEGAVHQGLALQVDPLAPLAIEDLAALSLPATPEGSGAPRRIVVALDPGTGKVLWTYDPKAYEFPLPTHGGFAHRAVEYWSDGDEQRIVTDVVRSIVDVLEQGNHCFCGVS